jgi:5-methylcytosine-specific restriction endonuclease McrA
MNYNYLLKHPKWFEKRETILLRDGGVCVVCGSESNLQVHHRQYHINKRTGRYVLPWDYKPRYLITLCSNCHQKGHSKFKIPYFKIKKIRL